MKLTSYELRQLEEKFLWQLPEEALRTVSATLLAGLKEAEERLRQTPNNSSSPPSSRPRERRRTAPDSEEPQRQERPRVGERGAAGGVPAARRKPGKRRHYVATANGYLIDELGAVMRQLVVPRAGPATGVCQVSGRNLTAGAGASRKPRIATEIE